jgi:hypothetical protein
MFDMLCSFFLYQLRIMSLVEVSASDEMDNDDRRACDDCSMLQIWFSILCQLFKSQLEPLDGENITNPTSIPRLMPEYHISPDEAIALDLDVFKGSSSEEIVQRTSFGYQTLVLLNLLYFKSFKKYGIWRRDTRVENEAFVLIMQACNLFKDPQLLDSVNEVLRGFLNCDNFWILAAAVKGCMDGSKGMWQDTYKIFLEVFAQQSSELVQAESYELAAREQPHLVVDVMRKVDDMRKVQAESYERAAREQPHLVEDVMREDALLPTEMYDDPAEMYEYDEYTGTHKQMQLSNGFFRFRYKLGKPSLCSNFTLSNASLRSELESSFKLLSKKCDVEGCEVRIRTSGNPEFFRVHRCVLVWSSPVFALFSDRQQEADLAHQQATSAYRQAAMIGRQRAAFLAYQQAATLSSQQAATLSSQQAATLAHLLEAIFAQHQAALLLNSFALRSEVMVPNVSVEALGLFLLNLYDFKFGRDTGVRRRTSSGIKNFCYMMHACNYFLVAPLLVDINKSLRGFLTPEYVWALASWCVDENWCREPYDILLEYVTENYSEIVQRESFECALLKRNRLVVEVMRDAFKDRELLSSGQLGDHLAYF